MMDRKNQERRFTVIPTIEITDTEPRAFWSRSPSPIEQPVIIREKASVIPSRVPKSLPYTPPDTLMFPLFSAIQRKAWGRAKRLCHELILCDPERNSYHELYVRLEQITNFIDRRFHPQSFVNQAVEATNSDGERSSRQQSQ